MLRSIQRYAQVALLIAGSAILLYSCDKESVAEEPNDEALMTEYSEHLTMTNTENGRKSYVFTAPLGEGYSLAKEPYQEFRKGVDIVTYQKDSTGAVDATLTANYAIHYGNRKLWEAKGNVRGSNADGNQLETEQLFWNQKSKRVYSNVDSKITQKGDVIYADGFESNERFDDFVMRKVKGKVTVDTTPKQDSVAGTPPAPEAPQQPPVKPGYPVIREGEAVARPHVEETKAKE